jgi:hypothetical protein
MENTSTLNAASTPLPNEQKVRALPELPAGWRVLGIALVLGIAADVLFYRQAIGLSAPIFAALVIGGMLLAFMAEPRTMPQVRRNLWLALPVLFFATMVFLRDEPFMSFLNIAASLLLLGLMFFTLGTNSLRRLTVMAYPVSILVGGILAAFSAIPLAGFVMAHLLRRRGNMGALARVGVGLIIALPIVLVFAALFAAADAVFAKALRTVFSFDLWKNLPDLAGQAVWIGFVAWLCAGALLMGLSRARQAPGGLSLEKPIVPIFRLGFVEAATVLACVNALFAVFVAIQFTYLFGGYANITFDGFTFAEYARRGFFELLAVAVLTMGLLLLLDWIARRDTPRQVTGMKALSLLLVALVLVILASAFQRMSLYESAYGYTSLRVYTHWFMLWMAAFFVLKATAIATERGQIFAFGGFLSLMVALAGFNLLNPDAFIAEQNIQRYLATGQLTSEPASGTSRTARLDTVYLTDMSADAVPVIMAHFAELRGAERQRVGGAMRFQMDDLYRRMINATWPSYNLARKQAIDALLAQRDTLNQFKPTPPGYRID